MVSLESAHTSNCALWSLQPPALNAWTRYGSELAVIWKYSATWQMLRKFPQRCFWVGRLGFLRMCFKKHKDRVVPLCFLPFSHLFSKNIRNHSFPLNWALKWQEITTVFLILAMAKCRCLVTACCTGLFVLYLGHQDLTLGAKCSKQPLVWLRSCCDASWSCFAHFYFLYPLLYCILTQWRLSKTYSVLKNHKKTILLCVISFSWYVALEIVVIRQWQQQPGLERGIIRVVSPISN